MKYDSLLADILHREKGFVNRASDKGGPTNWGITIPTLAKARGVAVATITIDDIRALTAEEAKEIYRQLYITPWEFIAEDELRDLMVDWFVTSQGWAVKAFQTYINDTDRTQRIAVDGGLGTETRQAWARLVVMAGGRTAEFAAHELAKERIRFFARTALDSKARKFMEQNPDTQLHNLLGWLNRGLEFL